jgi:hypothetical protein
VGPGPSGDGGVTIVVDDEGPGIAEGMRDAVFEPFRQGPAVPEHAPGVGVGLALVARFAELMGGRAWVEQSPAGGASFRVYLADGPRTSAEVAPRGRAQAGRRGFGQPTAGQAATTGWSTVLGPTWAAPPGDPMPLMVSLNHSALIGVNCFHSAGTSSS